MESSKDKSLWMESSKDKSDGGNHLKTKAGVRILLNTKTNSSINTIQKFQDVYLINKTTCNHSIIHNTY